MYRSLADQPASQLSRRADRIRQWAAHARVPLVARQLSEIALRYDDIATVAESRGAGVLTIADLPTGDLVDHLQKEARRFLLQAWRESDRSLADELRTLSANLDTEAVHLMSSSPT